MSFALLTYTQRLERHLIALASQVGNVQLPTAEAVTLGDLLAAAQENVAASLASARHLEPCPPLEKALRRVSAVLVGEEVAHPDSTVSFLLSRIVSDTTGLHSAVATE